MLTDNGQAYADSNRRAEWAKTVAEFLHAWHGVALERYPDSRGMTVAESIDATNDEEVKLSDAQAQLRKCFDECVAAEGIDPFAVRVKRFVQSIANYAPICDMKLCRIDSGTPTRYGLRRLNLP